MRKSWDFNFDFVCLQGIQLSNNFSTSCFLWGQKKCSCKTPKVLATLECSIKPLSWASLTSNLCDEHIDTHSFLETKFCRSYKTFLIQSFYTDSTHQQNQSYAYKSLIYSNPNNLASKAESKAYLLGIGNHVFLTLLIV